MKPAVASKRRETTGMRPLPVIAYFADDAIGAGISGRCSASGGCHSRRYAQRGPRRGTDRAGVQRRPGGAALNALAFSQYARLALTNFRFKDPRNDGAVYAYLPPDVPETLLERMADNALDHIHLVHTRHEVNQRLAGASQEIHELNQIGMALSSEHDPARLLELILTKSREFTRQRCRLNLPGGEHSGAGNANRCCHPCRWPKQEPWRVKSAGTQRASAV